MSTDVMVKPDPITDEIKKIINEAIDPLVHPISSTYGTISSVAFGLEKTVMTFSETGWNDIESAYSSATGSAQSYSHYAVNALTSFYNFIDDGTYPTNPSIRSDLQTFTTDLQNILSKLLSFMGASTEALEPLGRVAIMLSNVLDETLLLLSRLLSGINFSEITASLDSAVEKIINADPKSLRDVSGEGAGFMVATSILSFLIHLLEGVERSVPISVGLEFGAGAVASVEIASLTSLLMSGFIVPMQVAFDIMSNYMNLL
ncbi:MAG: hypothetical protein AAGB11_08115 [Pseudomonadota bacterium]